MNDPAFLSTGTMSNLRTSGSMGLPDKLVQEGLIGEAAMAEAIRASREAKEPLVAWLVAKNLVAARDIAITASTIFGVPLLDLDALSVDSEVVRLVSDKLLHKHHVLPLAKRGRRLFLAVADPTNLHAVDEIRFQTTLNVELVVVEEDKLQKMLARAIEQADTGMSSMTEDDFDLEKLDVGAGDEVVEAEAREDVADAPIVRFVKKVMLDAIKRSASDIHFEPYEKSYRVRLRVDGVLKEAAAPPVQLAGKLAARIKVMARLDIAERRVPQDGRIKMKLTKTRSVDFRISTCPTLFGEKIVMRILDPSSAMLGIDALGYEPAQRELYLKYLAKPQGMILVTGPTGSGKTVSLYTGLNILNTEDTNISTAEDPAEIILPGVNQVNVNPKVGLTFASALRSFLRQDPDVIMVGEVRDLETAEIAIKAAQTGHLVLSTLHTNDAPQTLTRLVDMGVKPYAIATSVSLIIAQRLARRLCNQCKSPVEIPRDALVREGFTPEEVGAGLRVYGPKGCPACTDGYKGRVGIYQVMPVTDTIGRIIMEGGNAITIADQARKEGVWDLRTAGLNKVREGLTSLDEVNRVTVD
jgi:type IV pilus assembly protein PilB